MEAATLVFMAIAIGLFVVIAIIRYRRLPPVSEEQNTTHSQNLDEILENHSELRSFVTAAMQGGASHFEYTGPGIIFYRTNNGRIERCLAEYGSGGFEWIWGPSDWREYKELPKHASPIPEAI